MSGTPDQPRLCVHRTLRHMYAQLIDDTQGKTLANASTMDKDVVGQVAYGGNRDAAAAVGKLLAERAQAAGLKKVCYDRGSLKYHGRVAALANAAREAGLVF
jgi:large subunit ribosomal protein L18